MILSLDTETTGGDWFHGARPFFVTTCTDGGKQLFWEWDVDPFTRQVSIPTDDVFEIASLIEEANEIVGQNLRFDIHALHHIGIQKFPWHKVQDTLIAGHLLASNQPHNLTDMVLHYLGDDIEPAEKRLHEIVEECRRMCRTKAFKADYGEVKLARKHGEDNPSASKSLWKLDMWLPRALAKLLKYPTSHVWYTVLRDYSNTDSLYTMALWQRMRKELEANKVY